MADDGAADGGGMGGAPLPPDPPDARAPPAADLLAALRLQAEWGADEALDPAPADRTRPAPVPDAARSTAPGPARDPAATRPAAAGPRPAAALPPALLSPAIVRPTGPPALARAAEAAAAATDLEALRLAMSTFEGSPLRDTATSIVFADGVPGSGLMLLGEAPGADEDRVGRPFVGVSGRLLDRMLASVGLTRERNLYLSNILPWRPPGNRTPTDAEIALFLPFVARHVALVRPRRLVLLGGTAAKALLRSKEGITRLRGRWHAVEVAGLGPVPALATLHPAYLLRNPAAKRDSWTDLRLLRRALDADAAGGAPAPDLVPDPDPASQPGVG